MLNEILARRVIFLVGKGGAGKTAVSGGFGLLAAGRGLRTLVMECDRRAPLASAFGVKPSYEPVEAGANLFAMVLDGRHALEEYLRIVVPARMILRAVFASRLYRFFVQAAPGLRELMMLGKILYEVERKPARQPHWDFIIVDAPASGQALSWLRMAEAARETFGGAIAGREAHNIARMLHDQATCAIIEVTTADSLAISELLETQGALREMRLAPAAIVFNRLNIAGFDASDVSLLERLAEPHRDLRRAGHLAEIARTQLSQSALALRALKRVREETRLPVIEVAEHPGLGRAALMNAIASSLAAMLDAEGAHRAATRG